MRELFFLFFIFSSVSFYAQEDRKPLHGKIKSDTENLSGIYVNNKTAGKNVKTSHGGYFTIGAGVNDTLVFSSVNFLGKEHIVTEDDFKSDLIIVEMQALVTELDEVVVEGYRDINSESLGLVPKGQKQYTREEKMLFTSQNGVDGIFNAISGRTKEMKKAVEIAGKRSLMTEINYIFTPEEIIEKFKIPSEYVDGFIFYAVEDKEFAGAIKKKENGIAKFLMAGLAVKYLEIINEDKDANTTDKEK